MDVTTSEEREQERELFEAERKRVPEFFVREPMIDDVSFTRWVGIEDVFGRRPVGYTKLVPQDFIVEEISKDGTVRTVDIGESLPERPTEEGKTYYADLVKIGISTLEARSEIAKILGVDEKNISFAGIKDRLAITSQEISIRGIVDADALDAINADNFFIKNIRLGKGVISNGQLSGNRFGILLRLPDAISLDMKKEMERKLNEIKEDGFWNFFYFQRFGTPRLISHVLGLLLLKGKYEETIRTFLTYEGSRELPYFKIIRKEIAEIWGDWNAIRKKVDRFPYHFHLERSFIHHLIARPRDFLGALHTLPDQIRLWMYAYDCFLFNRKLSELIEKGEVSMTLPLITSFNPNDWKPYAHFLEADEARLPSRSYRDFPFIRVESRTWPTLQRLDVHGAVFEERIAAFSFSLPKGSYATTFLMNFFVLASGLPIVPGIPMDAVDTPAMLGTGTLAPILERFKTVLIRRDADVQGVVAEE